MSSAPIANPSSAPREPEPWAAFLSYLIPGLGQIVQGRYGKGTLFMASLLGMFMLGQGMGDWSNVYVYAESNDPNRGPKTAGALMNRWHYAGQFWIGVAAWPALVQHFEVWVPGRDTYPLINNFQRMPREADVNILFQNSDKTPDLGWVYTVIAGMLNLLVIYDAYAGPMFPAITRKPDGKTDPSPTTQTKTEGAA
ncbi:MAG: hypothetical protein EXS16_15600 [Gemmataceae bacterium]|nr:hypothetical protein [Gemmataceae bacterium]